MTIYRIPLALVAAALSVLLLGCGHSVPQPIRQINSRDGQFTALLYVDEGSVVIGGNWYAVTLSKGGPPEWPGIIHPYTNVCGLQGPGAIQIRWSGPRQLTVACTNCDRNRFFIDKREWKGVTIKYSFSRPAIGRAMTVGPLAGPNANDTVFAVTGWAFRTRNTVVTSAASPDGKSTAVLVDRYYDAARVADEFFIVVVKRQENIREAVTARNLGKSSALVATRASKVELRWQNKDTLIVICDSCGLSAIDIEKKVDRIGSVGIIYQGFPNQTAE